MAHSTTDSPLTKEQKRAAKAEKQQRLARQPGQLPAVVDVGCVLHGRAYDWIYVERLYNMVRRYLRTELRFHVWTEHDRSVPPHMIKHCLEEWPGISGPRKSWWYKMQIFDTRHHAGELLFLDLDMVIVRDLGWIVGELTDCFWTIRDFRRLQQISNITMNSSIMWFDTQRWYPIWQEFCKEDITQLSRRYHGDQDYLHAVIPSSRRRYFADELVASYRWQALDGGYDFRTRRHHRPGSGTQINKRTSIVVFHGRPKPHQAHQDQFVLEHWI